MHIEGSVEFVLGEDLVLRKLRFADPVEPADTEDLDAEMAARFLILHETLGALFDALEPAFKLSEVA